MIPAIDATFLRLQLQKLMLKKGLDKIFILSSNQKIVVRFVGRKEKDGALKDLLMLTIKQNLNMIESGLLDAALYANAKNIRTQLTEGIERIEKSILEQRVLPVLIHTDGKIYDRSKNEIDLTDFFSEVQKYLPAHIDRVGEEE